MRTVTHNQKALLQLAFVDFLLVSVIYLLSRISSPGDYHRWYWMLIMALVWAVLGIITHKLEFWQYSSKHKAVVSIAVIDGLVFALNYVLRNLFLNVQIDYSNLLVLLAVVIVEWIFYLTWHLLYRRLPFLDVTNVEHSLQERGMENAPVYVSSDNPNPDLERVFEQTRQLSGPDSCQWIRDHRQEFAPATLVIEMADPSNLDNIPAGTNLIICLEPFNKIKDINVFFEKANAVLPDGGILTIWGETSTMRRSRILSSYPAVIGQFIAYTDYLWSRIMSKLVITRKLYKTVTGGRDHNFPRVEVLGRVARAGFQIRGDEIKENAYIVTAVRKREPVAGKPFYGLLVRLPRRGYNGEEIGVFKLRTMYAYSEYVQDYVYELNGLEPGGKLKSDFRINTLGRFCRKRFIDELPMLLNLFSGDLKLVGVRPLSQHYLSLYTPQMQQLHLSVKPGILPPLYFEKVKPVSIEDIQESERRYIESYRKHPLRTDWKYFWGIIANVLFKRERSH